MLRTQGKQPVLRVSERGAAAGAVVRGTGLSNRGLRLRVLQDQPRGNPGPVAGNFVILDVGENIHSQALKPLLNRVTNAEEVLRLLRQQRPSCLNVANASILVLEPQSRDD